MAQKERRKRKVRELLQRFETEAQEAGLKYFIGVIDRTDKATRNDGDGYLRNDMTGEDFVTILDMAFADNESLIHLAIYVKQVMQSRNLIATKKQAKQ